MEYGCKFARTVPEPRKSKVDLTCSWSIHNSQYSTRDIRQELADTWSLAEAYWSLSRQETWRMMSNSLSIDDVPMRINWEIWRRGKYLPRYIQYLTKERRHDGAGDWCINHKWLGSDDLSAINHQTTSRERVGGFLEGWLCCAVLYYLNGVIRDRDTAEPRQSTWGN